MGLSHHCPESHHLPILGGNQGLMDPELPGAEWNVDFGAIESSF